MGFITCVKKNLNVYGVKSKDLAKYTTSEKDVGKGKTRIPGEKFILDSENVLTVGEPNKSKSSSSSEEVKVVRGEDEELWSIAE